MPQRRGPRTEFGRHVKNLREGGTDWTLEEAAAQPAWGYSRGYLNEIELGRKKPSIDVIEMLVRLYEGQPGASYEILMLLRSEEGKMSHPPVSNAEVLDFSERRRRSRDTVEVAHFAPSLAPPETRGKVPLYGAAIYGAKGGFVLSAQPLGDEVGPAGELFERGRLFAIFMRGTRMGRAIPDGTLLYVDRLRSPALGGECLLTLRATDRDPEVSFIRDFVSDDGAQITVRCYPVGQAPEDEAYKAEEVKSVLRILGRNEEKGVI